MGYEISSPIVDRKYLIRQEEVWKLFEDNFPELQGGEIMEIVTSEGGSTREHTLSDVWVTVQNQVEIKPKSQTTIDRKICTISKEEYAEFIAYRNMAYQVDTCPKCKVCGFPCAKMAICATCGKDGDKFDEKLRNEIINHPEKFDNGPLELDE